SGFLGIRCGRPHRGSTTEPGGQITMRSRLFFAPLVLLALAAGGARVNDHRVDQQPPLRAYDNRLTPIPNPAPLLADHPDYVEPIRTGPRFEAPLLIDDPNADLDARAWRCSYNS